MKIRQRRNPEFFTANSAPSTYSDARRSLQERRRRNRRRTVLGFARLFSFATSSSVRNNNESSNNSTSSNNNNNNNNNNNENEDSENSINNSSPSSTRRVRFSLFTPSNLDQNGSSRNNNISNADDNEEARNSNTNEDDGEMESDSVRLNPSSNERSDALPPLDSTIPSSSSSSSFAPTASNNNINNNNNNNNNIIIMNEQQSPHVGVDIPDSEDELNSRNHNVNNNIINDQQQQQQQQQNRMLGLQRQLHESVLRFKKFMQLEAAAKLFTGSLGIVFLLLLTLKLALRIDVISYWHLFSPLFAYFICDLMFSWSIYIACRIEALTKSSLWNHLALSLFNPKNFSLGRLCSITCTCFFWIAYLSLLSVKVQGKIPQTSTFVVTLPLFLWQFLSILESFFLLLSSLRKNMRMRQQQQNLTAVQKGERLVMRGDSIFNVFFQVFVSLFR